LGTEETYNEVYILFFLVGSCFGISYNMNHVECMMDWLFETPWYLKILRAVIGGGLTYGLWFGITYLFGNNVDENKL